jgi:hypothetical protein
MSVRYQTEYYLGRRGRVCRTYSGIQALIAITFDLILGLIFGLVGLGWRLVRRLFDLAFGVIFGLIGLGWRLVRCLTVTTCRVAVALVSLPLRAARAIVGQAAGCPVVKPRLAAFDEF